MIVKWDFWVWTILKWDKVIQLHLDLFNCSDLTHFYLEQRKSNWNRMIYERYEKIKPELNIIWTVQQRHDFQSHPCLMLSIVMLSVVMLSVIRPVVVAPSSSTFRVKITFFVFLLETKEKILSLFFSKKFNFIKP